MRPRNWRWSFAAAAMLAFIPAAQAQTPRPAKSFVMSMPGQAPTAAVMPAGNVAPAGNYAMSGGADGAAGGSGPLSDGCGAGGGGCSSNRFMCKMRNRFFGSTQGCANPVTCGNWKTDGTFIFGNCCQFFGHGKDCGSCGRGLCNKCPGVAYGQGGSPMNPCCYDSYLNH